MDAKNFSEQCPGINGLIHSRKSCSESPWVHSSPRPWRNSGEDGLHLEERIIHLWSY